MKIPDDLHQYKIQQDSFGFGSVGDLRASLLARAESDFDSVDKKALSEYGIRFTVINDKSVSCYNSRDPLSAVNDDSCSLSKRAIPVNADEAFIERWSKTSPSFESWLLRDGWRKTWNANQPIAEILDKPDNNGSIGVNYQKYASGIGCTLSFKWVQPHDPNQLNATQMCFGKVD